MGRIILYIATSKDGKIADEDGSVKWLTPYQNDKNDYGFHAMYDNIDYVLMGSGTYDKIQSFHIPYPYKGKKSYVFSHQSHDKNDDVIFINESELSFLENLKHTKGNAWVVGGSKFINFLMKYHLIDEMIVTVVPIVLKGGVPLFEKGINQYLTKHREIPFENGVVQEIYINE